MTMEKSLRKALDNDEFKLEYQPIINLTTGEISGIEALLRWESLEMGRVQPSEFIPVAEETRLILKVGEWVLRNTCRQIKKWMDAGLPSIRVGVNLSIIQFVQGNFLTLIQEILDRGPGRGSHNRDTAGKDREFFLPRRIKKPFFGKPFLELLKCKLERPDAAGFQILKNQLIIPAGFIHRQPAPAKDLLAILRFKADTPGGKPKKNTTDLG